MPVILRFKGYVFFFYSNEGNPLEPAHIHVRNADSEAKFWLEPEIALGRNDGFNSKELREIFIIVEKNKTQFTEAWYDYFS
ncbi:DUF4160 domain-containing protein [Rodentibacter heidelbergensis]|uniref:DUF4160 domain-containing protein n=1 Tax=Rodentibacter heidelbergensis TaxID=1908258 RepID=A0A1V3I9V0_9PAST|nr:DUF4160 domain-containing protein [Rodentibacter heidelbergensis]OOF36903.1 hypothetical protein BKK48_03550 [Rodentibacter heidelbergensis]